MNCGWVAGLGVAGKLPVIAYNESATWSDMMFVNAFLRKREEGRLQKLRYTRSW
jgi:hypothetical protein